MPQLHPAPGGLAQTSPLNASSGDVSTPDLSKPAAVTDLLHDWYAGRREALDELLPHIVDEIRLMARGYLAKERACHSYQATDLVQEAYLRLVGEKVQAFGSRRELFAFVARLLRQILIDHSRAKQRRKRGDGRRPATLDEALIGSNSDLDAGTVLAVDQALDQLEALNPRHRQVVELRYFVGLTVPEIAKALDLSVPTVERDWAVARRFLGRQLA